MDDDEVRLLAMAHMLKRQEEQMPGTIGREFYVARCRQLLKEYNESVVLLKAEDFCPGGRG